MSQTPPPQPDEPEYLELGEQPPRRPRRGLAVGIVAGLLLVLGVPLGTLAAFQLLGGGGTQPHDVLPANAVGYVRVDLDPSAPEKIDAVRFLRTFPAFEKYTRITDDRADVRRAIVEAILDPAPCDLDYADDVAPWLGERFGVAATAPSSQHADPGLVAAIEVSDEDAARTGLQRLRACGPDDDAAGGWTYLDGYMIVADSRQQAREYADAATRSPLAANDQFRADMQRLGDPGIASAWFSGDGLYRVFNAEVIGDPGPAGGEFDLLRDQVRRQIARSYHSGAVALRFDDRYLELATVVTGDGYREPAGGHTVDMDLPRSTAVAVGLADGAEYVDRQWETILMGAGEDHDRVTAELERASGLRLPGDLQTLLGDSFTLALDGADLDFGALAQTGNPALLDLGVRAHTDGAAFSRTVAKLQAAATRHGVPLDLAVRRTDDGAVAALNDGYAAELSDRGSLSGTDAFTTAVPDAEKAGGVFFVNLDMLERPVLDLLTQAGAADAELTDNLSRLQALGVTSSSHDGYATGTLRLTVGD